MAQHELDKAKLLLADSKVRILCSLFELGQAERLAEHRQLPIRGALQQQHVISDSLPQESAVGQKRSAAGVEGEPVDANRRRHTRSARSV